MPARVPTVAGDAVAARPPRLLPDAPDTLAGVSLYDDLGPPIKRNPSTRGLTVGPTVGLPPGVSVLVDVVRLRGSASPLGANSLGGPIDLVPARGRDPASSSPALSTATLARRRRAQLAPARASGRRGRRPRPRALTVPHVGPRAGPRRPRHRAPS